MLVRAKTFIPFVEFFLERFVDAEIITQPMEEMYPKVETIIIPVSVEDRVVLNDTQLQSARELTVIYNTGNPIIMFEPEYELKDSNYNGHQFGSHRPAFIIFETS